MVLDRDSREPNPPAPGRTRPSFFGEKKDATPVAEFQVTGNPSVGLRVKVVDADGPSLVLAALLQVK